MQSLVDPKSCRKSPGLQRQSPNCAWRRASYTGRHSTKSANHPCGSILELAAQVGFQPDPIQTEILLSDAKEILLLMSRQTGKSTVVALKALHLALTRPGAQILTAGRVGRQSSELILKVRTFLRALNITGKGDGVNKNSILLSNGSRFIPVSGKPDNSRGYSAINMLIIDEAAFASQPLYVELRPMLAVTNGTIILLSTANGRQGFFYDAWIDRSDPWERFHQAATECPRITPEFLEREKLRMPDFAFRQEYFCEFIDGAGSLFRFDALQACLDANFQVRDL